MAEPFGWEDIERKLRAPPDQDQRLRGDAHGLGPHRRTRPWIVAAIGLLLVAVFVAIVAFGPEGEPDGPIGAPSAAAVD